jgi:hypothetical protein
MDELRIWGMSFAVAGFAFLVGLRLARGFAASKERYDNLERPKDDAGAFKFAGLEKPERVRILAWSFKGGTVCDQRLVFEIPAEDFGDFLYEFEEDWVIPGYPVRKKIPEWDLDEDEDEKEAERKRKEEWRRILPPPELEILVTGQPPIDSVRHDEELGAWLRSAPGWRFVHNFTDVYSFRKAGEDVVRIFAITRGK